MLEDLKVKLYHTPVYSMYKNMKTGAQKITNTEVFPKNNTWAFNAGNTFSGNPKYLFIYINKYRKDIDAYWLCDDEITIEYVRKLGYKAYLFQDKEAKKLIMRTGVYVVEQVKESFPDELKEAKVKVLNLFHGVGCKSIEKRISCNGFLGDRVARKYIRHNRYYHDYQLFLVTSPLMEKHFKYYCDLADDRVIRGGYPRCIYQKYYDKIETFDHDIRGRKGVSADAKLAVYAPTFRDNQPEGFMSRAIPDMDKLIEKLEEMNMVMIFKMHPLIEADFEYIKLKEKYQDHPRLMFWDNHEDIYEIFSDIEVGIIDYSSIFYDMLAGGTKHFIRYFFDYDGVESFRHMAYDTVEMTCGKMCKNFDALMEALGSYEEDDSEDRARIEKLFWEYEDEGTMERIIDTALEFKAEDTEQPTLYTFDVFDTLISRKVLEPIGIFYKVQEKMQESELGFPKFLLENYPNKRKEAEANVREWYRKTLAIREDEREEIYFEEIFSRMAEMYNLNAEQINMLMQWEKEAEYADSIPIRDTIAYVKDLRKRGETVCLVSDMYLDKEFILQLLKKADPELAEIPLFLSCEHGVQKVSGGLYLKVYENFEPYDFGDWIHCGDNHKADIASAKRLGITAVLHPRVTFNDYEWSMVRKIGSYEAFLVAAELARFREKNGNIKDYYAYAHISMYFVPYISWVLREALKRETKCLYFISRDGYQLKRVADEIIACKGLDIKTKYIYGSRKAWRIPSQITEIDKEYFSGFGNFVGVSSYPEVLRALHMEEEEFMDIFPNLGYLKEEELITKEMRDSLISTFANSERYRAFILDKAAKERAIILDYLRQEVDVDEKFAFVEYWARGYTQECLARLLENASGKKCEVPFYYMRSIYGTEGHIIRYNYTTAVNSLIFVEALFATIPYMSIEQYKYTSDGMAVPDIRPAKCDMELFHSMERCLIQFVDDFYAKHWHDEEALERALQKFSVEYFEENQEDAVFTECLAKLKYTGTMYAEEQEYAPAFTEEMVEGIMRETPVSYYTKSMAMSLARSEKRLADKVWYIKECVPELRREGNRKMAKIEARDQENLKASGKIELHRSRAVRFQSTYQKYAKNAVEKGKVVLFTNDTLTDQDEYWSLERELGKKEQVKILRFRRKSAFDEEILREMATAEYIFTNRHFELMSLLKFRKETHVVQLGEFAFALDSFGRGVPVPDYLKDLKKWKSMAMENDYCLIAAASDTMKEVYEASYCMEDSRAAVKTVGSCCTDIYFSEEFRNEARSSLEQIFPAAKGKKVIVYLPQYRHRTKGCRVLEFLDVRKLREALQDEYVLVTDFRVPAGMDSYMAASDMRDFFCDLTNKMSIRRMIAAGDVFVGDYRNTFFEAFLRRKPVFLTADDYVEYVKNRDNNFDYGEILPAPVISDANDLIYRLQDLDAYDYEKLEGFCEKYLGACDGHAAERIIEQG